MNKINVAVIAGGDSGEYEVSLKSQAGILSFLDKDLFSAIPVIITSKKWVVIGTNGEELPIDKNDFSYCSGEEKVRFDFAYITIHGTPGENGLLPGYFEMIGIPHSTCPAFVSALTFNKFFCNRSLSALGYNVAKAILLRKGDSYNEQEIVNRLGLPLFVKPNAGGSSVATTKVKKVEDLHQAITVATVEGGDVILEQLLTGTEVTCGCYQDGSGIHVLPVTEVVSKNEFFDFDAKYNGQVEEITPARIPDEQFATIQELTVRIYSTLNAKGIIRIDYFISADGTPYLVEVNTTPGMTPTSFIPQQVEVAGESMKDVLRKVILHNMNV
ncbi:MAG: D-alanine--D-alanine ligase [Porphyromonas sp.]|nr:D-alanine--D-alanine ligase [Porphyromonas sp.]